MFSLSRQQSAIKREQPLEGDYRTKWGIFADDPRAPTWVDTSGVGMHYTINLAKPWGRFWAVVLMGIPLIVLLWLIIQPLLSR